MIAPPVALALALNAADAPAVECPPDDDRCRAAALEARAEDDPSPILAAKLLRAALSLRLSTFERSGSADDLCAAHETARRGDTIEGGPEESAAEFQAARRDLAAAARKRGVVCDAGRATPQARVALLAPATPPRRHAPPPTNNDNSPPRPRTPLVVAGATSLAAGISLLGVATFAGVQMNAALREGRALVASVDGPADSATIAHDAALRDRYRDMGNLALGSGIAGGVATVVGAVLLGVSRPRRDEGRPRAAFAPTPGGLVLSGRF